MNLGPLQKQQAFLVTGHLSSPRKLQFDSFSLVSFSFLAYMLGFIVIKHWCRMTSLIYPHFLDSCWTIKVWSPMSSLILVVFCKCTISSSCMWTSSFSTIICPGHSTLPSHILCSLRKYLLIVYTWICLLNILYSNGLYVSNCL